MKIIQENIRDIDVADIVYLKESYVNNLRCIVAGLKNGRRLPLTMLETIEACKNPIYELDEFFNGELLKDFYVGDFYLFAVKKGEVNALYVKETEQKDMVRVSAKFATPYFRDDLMLTYQPNTKRLNKIKSDIRAEYLARKEAEQGGNDGSSFL